MRISLDAAGIGLAQFVDGQKLNGQAMQTLVTPQSIILAAGVSAAVEIVKPSAEGGLGTLETLIADAYYYGHGVSRNYAEAAHGSRAVVRARRAAPDQDQKRN